MPSRSKMLIICLVSMTQFMAETMMRQIIPLQARSLGAAPDLIGLIVSSYSFLPLLIAIPSGEIIDRVGFRAMIATSCIGMAAASAILVLFPTIPGLVISQVVAGVMTVIVILAAQAYVGRISDVSNRTLYFSVYSLVMAGGFLVGPPLGGIIADLSGYIMTFAIAGILSVLASLLVILLPPPAAQETDNGVSSPTAGGMAEMLHQGRRLLRRRDVQMALYISILGLFGLSMRNSFYPLYLDQIGYSTSRIGVLIALQSAVSLLVRPFMTTLLRGGFLLPTSLAMMVGAIGIGLTPYFTGFAPLAAVSILYGLTTAVSQPVSMILMASGSDLEHQGLAMGLRQTANQAAMLASPVFLGLLAARLSIGHSFLFTAILWTGGSITLLLIRKASRRMSSVS